MRWPSPGGEGRDEAEIQTTDSVQLFYFTHLLPLPALFVWKTKDSWGKSTISILRRCVCPGHCVMACSTRLC
jgi:hypothetical protein